jgi:hypothetical protein
MHSFNQDAALQQQLLAQLRLKQQQDVWEKNVLAWDGTQGSVVGHILNSDDLSAWEQLGLPKWLAISIDYFYVTAHNPTVGIEAGIELFAAIQPGLDLQNLGSQYLLELLSDAQQGLGQMPMSAVMATAYADIMAFHQQCVAGQTITASAWRQLRKDLVHHTNQFAVDSLDHRIGICLEAAAWDPMSSRTVVADAVRAWILLHTQLEVAKTWTAADDQQIRQLLKQLHDAAMATAAPEQTIDVFALLEAQHPEQARRLKQHIAQQNQQPQLFWQQALSTLQRLLSAA